MSEDDWTHSKWSAGQLNHHSIVFCLHDGQRVHNDRGTLIAYKRCEMVEVSILSAEWSRKTGRQVRILLTQEQVSLIETHPDPSVAKFQIKAVPLKLET